MRPATIHPNAVAPAQRCYNGTVSAVDGQTVAHLRQEGRAPDEALVVSWTRLDDEGMGKPLVAARALYKPLITTPDHSDPMFIVSVLSAIYCSTAPRGKWP